MKQPETLSPSEVYSKSPDKQRVVIVGGQAKIITAMVIYVLEAYAREFDVVLPPPAAPRLGDAPVVIIEAHGASPSMVDYHHHIGVISEVTPGTEPVFSQFADATPKGGVLIYSEAEPVGSIGKKERPHITTVSYKAYPHVIENGTVALISSLNERKTIRLRGEQNLRNISAAKEILKKLAITSSQFYQAIARFEA